MAHGRLSKFIVRNKQPYLSCPYCGNPVLTLPQRAALHRPHSRKCKFCLKRYHIPRWCHFLQITGLTTYILVAIYLNFFNLMEETILSYIINVLIAVVISNIIGAVLAFVAPLQKDEPWGTISGRRQGDGSSVLTELKEGDDIPANDEIDK